MFIISITEAKAHLGAFMTRCVNRHEVFIITRYGKPGALLIAVDDQERFDRYGGTASPAFRALLSEAMEAHQQGQSVSAEYFWERMQEGYGQA